MHAQLRSQQQAPAIVTGSGSRGERRRLFVGSPEKPGHFRVRRPAPSADRRRDCSRQARDPFRRFLPRRALPPLRRGAVRAVLHAGRPEKKAARMGVGSVRTEVWEKLRLFELDRLLPALRLLTGLHVRRTQAARASAETAARRDRFAARRARADALPELGRRAGLQVLETVRKYAEWSFSLGVVAI